MQPAPRKPPRMRRKGAQVGVAGDRSEVQAVGALRDSPRQQPPLAANCGGSGRIEMPPLECVKRRT
jgi:hypothetical protein